MLYGDDLWDDHIQVKEDYLLTVSLHFMAAMDWSRTIRVTGMGISLYLTYISKDVCNVKSQHVPYMFSPPTIFSASEMLTLTR